MADESFIRLDYVNFLNVKENYVCNSPLQVTIKFDPQFPHSVKDWVGLFKVGWTSIEEKIVSKNIPKESVNKLECKFVIESEKLPEEEEEFFHLCYITHNEQLAGVSIPFQFSADDFEIIGDFDLNEGELCSKLKDVQLENSRLREEMELIQKEKLELSKKVDELSNSATSDEVLTSLSVQNNELLGRIEALQKENMELKNSPTPKVSLANAKSYSFMDEYYDNNIKGEMKGNGNVPEVVRPIGFENHYPSTWVTYENHPNTAYPEPTWFPNPYIHYQPGSNANIGH